MGGPKMYGWFRVGGNNGAEMIRKREGEVHLIAVLEPKEVK